MQPEPKNDWSVLVVDDDRDFAEGLGEVLRRLGRQVQIVHSADAARGVMLQHRVRIGFVDLKLATANGLELIQSLKQEWPDCLFVLITAYSSLDSAVEALHIGAYDYLRKPFSVEDLRISLARATDRLLAEDQKRAAEDELAASNRELRFVNDRLEHLVSLTKGFAGCMSVEALYPRLLRAFADSMGAAGGSLYTLAEDELRLAGTLDPEHALPVIPLPAQRPGVLSKVLETRAPILVPDISKAGDILPSGWRGYGDESLVAFPIGDADGQIHAIVSLHSKGIPPFTQMDLHLGVVLAGHVCETLRATTMFESLASSERKYRDLAEGSIQGICVHDGQHFQFANTAWLAIFGLERPAQLGSLANPVELLPPELLHMEVDADQVGSPARIGHSTGKLFKVRHRSGTLRWVEAMAREIQWEGRSATQITAVDVTARVEAEEQSRAHQRQLVQSDKLAALGTLVAGIAHEVNNPINLIGLNVSLLQRIWGDLQEPVQGILADRAGNRIGGVLAERIPATMTRLMSGIEDGSVRVQHIIGGLKDFSGKQEDVEYDAVDVNSVVSSAIDLTRGSIRIATQEFQTELSDCLPPVRGNRIELAQVLVNLITNACQALTSTSQRICVRSYRDPEAGSVVIEVHDDGTGISPEDLTAIFDPFFTTKRERGGTGLGLYVCYNIVREHQGTLDLTSTPGTGTCARLSLPVATDAAMRA